MSQSAQTGMVICNGFILLWHLVLNVIKTNAASSDKSEN